VGDDRNFDIKDWCGYGFAEQVLVTLVIWVGDQCNTGRKQFWASGLNEDLAVWAIEANTVVGARLLAVF
jgi:hypothetical protein